MKRRKEIELRMNEIRKELQDPNCDVDALEKEIRELKKELNEIEKAEKRRAIAKELEEEGEMSEMQMRKVEKPKDNINTEAEKRGKTLKEGRAVTIGTEGVIAPSKQSKELNGTFNEVSSLIDRIKIKPMYGAETYKEPYVIGYGEGDYTLEGTAANETDPSFGYAEINKTKITAYTEESEELIKLTDTDYDTEITKNVRIAVRKKGVKEILVGDGSSGHFVGIFSENADAIDSDKDISISEIDEDTLDEIIFEYGGDEEVEDEAVLILNKKDLKGFATLKDYNGMKVYNVVKKGNTGTIDNVPYIINSACKAISSDVTESGDYAMAYGPLSSYTVAIFSDMEVSRSTDYKFKEGMIAHKAVSFMGGNVTAYNGFLRVKKK